MQKIDSLTLTVPADGIEWIGIGAHSVNEETSSDVKDEEDPERRSISQQMKLLWKEVTEKLENDTTTLGLCDLETDVFFNLFNEAAIKPSNFQFSQVLKHNGSVQLLTTFISRKNSHVISGQLEELLCRSSRPTKLLQRT